MEAPVVRQRMTLSDRLSALQSSSNLRDLLKVRDDDVAAVPGPRRSTSTVTLASILEAEKNAANTSSSSSTTATGSRGGRTLLDVIREDEESRGGGGGGGGGGSSRWRDLTERLRVRPAATPTAGSASTPASERSEPSTSDADRSGGSGAIRVSLMTLMEMRESEGEEEEIRRVAVMAEAEAAADGAHADVEEEMAGERERHVCCVCMVRRKGAAFIPCGHTFCRICSRELLMGRGNCPLCNATILEVLDIF